MKQEESQKSIKVILKIFLPIHNWTMCPTLENEFSSEIFESCKRNRCSLWNNRSSQSLEIWAERNLLSHSQYNEMSSNSE